MKKRNQKCQKGSSIKLRFYFMSLWLLFVLISLSTLDIPICFHKNARFIGFVPLLKRNWLALSFLLLALIGWIMALNEQWKWKGVSNPPYKIQSVKNESYEYLTFLTTYIIPFVGMEFNECRSIVILGVLLLVIGYIFISMDLYYGNPTLALMGYRLYRVDIKGFTSPDGILLISKDRLSTGSSITWIPIDEYVWIAKELTNDDR